MAGSAKKPIRQRIPPEIQNCFVETIDQERAKGTSVEAAVLAANQTLRPDYPEIKKDLTEQDYYRWKKKDSKPVSQSRGETFISKINSLRREGESRITQIEATIRELEKEKQQIQSQLDKLSS